MTLALRPLRGLFRNINLFFVAHPSLPASQQHVKYFFKRVESTLSRSFVLIQDGTEIKELPWIVRKLNSNEVLGNDNNVSVSSPQVSDVKSNSLEKQFKTILQGCNSMEEVIQLLEMPGKSVTPETAASVLSRIGMFNSVGEHLGSFIRRAVLNELCEMVCRDFTALTSRTVIDLIKCCLRPNCYENKFMDSIKTEVEQRIVNNSFSIPDVCEMVTVLSEHTGGKFQDILETCWVHLGSRFSEINATNISDVFEVLRYTTESSKYLITVVDKQVHSCWSELTSSDVATISKWLSFFNHHSIASMSCVGKWLYSNVHSLNVEQMRDVLGMYIHFGFVHGGLVHALEKFLRAYAKCTGLGGNNLKDRTVIHMAALLCRMKRMLSPRILNAIALDFSLSPKSYDLKEGVSVLKTFGILGFAPDCSQKFFTAAECWIQENLHLLSLEDSFEVLVSFAYIERYPVNFLKKLFDTRLPEIFSERISDKIRANVSRNLLELQSSFILEFPQKPDINVISRDALQVSLTWLDARSLKFHREVSTMLKDLLGEDTFLEFKIPRPTPYFINFEIIVDSFKNPMDIHSKSNGSKLAVILIMPESLTSKGTFMGQMAMKLRHLEKLDFTPILVDYDNFSVKCQSPSERISYLSNLLSSHVNISA